MENRVEKSIKTAKDLSQKLIPSTIENRFNLLVTVICLGNST